MFLNASLCHWEDFWLYYLNFHSLFNKAILVHSRHRCDVQIGGSFSVFWVVSHGLPFSEEWLNHFLFITPILLKVFCLVWFGLVRLANDCHVVKCNGHFSVIIVFDFLRPFHTSQKDSFKLILTSEINNLTSLTFSFLTL